MSRIHSSLLPPVVCLAVLCGPGDVCEALPRALRGQQVAPPRAVRGQQVAPPRFEDISVAAGLEFRHYHGGTGEKHLPETMGSGVAWIDFDGDGRWDLYLVDSGPVPADPAVARGAERPQRSSRGAIASPGGSATTIERRAGANALFRANSDGTFSLAVAAGAADLGYGMGVTAADYDGDGWTDLFVTNFGPNALYRNNGDGTFDDVTDTAGVGDPRWSASAAWGDLDDDGLAELYVSNYVAYDPANPFYCGNLDLEQRSYCHIDLFDGVADAVYHNRGDGTFDEFTEGAGLANDREGKGLGVVMGDLDGAGRTDIYVANDTTRNFLYINHGSLRFEDVGLIAGVGYSEDGMPQAGMGVDAGDIDGDGRLDIIVTNFALEPVNLYREMAPGIYLDDTFPLGLGEDSLPVLGFGAALADFDGDGDLDVAIANGHILDDVASSDQTATSQQTTYAQPNQIFVNRLVELQARPQRDLLENESADAGEAITRARVSRGLAVGDADGDGRPDLAVTNSNGPAELLRNTSQADANRLVVRLRGRAANRDALGARIWVDAGSEWPTQLLEVKSASSYLSQNATDLYVGLGAGRTARLRVQWPGGEVEEVGPVEAGRLLLIVEGRGVVASRPLNAR